MYAHSARPLFSRRLYRRNSIERHVGIIVIS